MNPTTTEDAFLADVLTHPRDPAPRLIFADWLDERGPTPVETSRVPNWLRLGWLRNRGRARLVHQLPFKVWSTAGWDVAVEIDNWLGGVAAAVPARHYVEFDHWGRTTVAGHLCFVSEPCAGARNALESLTPLATLLGCPLAFARRTWHGDVRNVGGLVRVLLFPPLPG